MTAHRSVLGPLAMLVIATAALAGCGTDAPPPTPTTTTPTATATTTSTTAIPVSAKTASPVTTNACLTFQQDPAIAKVKQAIGSGSTSIDTTAMADAFDVVFDLEVVATQPGLDPDVADAMTEASRMSTAMRKAWVEDATVDPTGFLRMLDYVTSACEKAGVDLA